MIEHPKHPHASDIEELLSELATTRSGLREEEVGSRLAHFGPNTISGDLSPSVLKILIKQFRSWLVGVLMIAAVISWIAGHTIDAWVILVVVLINAAIGFFQEYRADKAVRALQKQAIKNTKLMRNGKVITTKVESLVPGDIIVVEEGDYVPADARIIEAKNLRTVEASLTGESLPVAKSIEKLPQETLVADRYNMLWKGTFSAGGFAHAVVTATGQHTAIGNISSMLTSIVDKKSHFMNKTDKLAKQMAYIAFASAGLLFVVGFFIRGFELQESLLVFIAALVAAVPEGLAAVISIVLAIGANRMAKRNALVREFTATETLGAVNCILTDKTGTLTQNTLVVRKVFMVGEADISVTGEGWFPVGNLMQQNSVIEPDESDQIQQFLKIAALSNNSQINHDQEANSYELIGDPTEGALNVLARKCGFNSKLSEIKKLDDLPFDSQLKMRATLITDHGQNELLVVGAPEKVLEKCTRTLTPNAEKELDQKTRADIKSKIDEWSESAHRVIGLAYATYSAEKIDEENIKDLTFAGIVGMVDPPRKDVKEAVEKCRQAGIRVIMVTGDHVKTAMAIAQATGILDQKEGESTSALTEHQLDQLDEEEFDQVISTTSVFARLSPKMKLRIAERLQQLGYLIAMTGDGVNDAPALKGADVGVSMGIIGTDVARFASDVVLTDDNFATIVKAVEEGRIVFNNARQTSFFLVTTNLAEISTLVLSILWGLPMPLTATQILWLNLVTDGVTDMSLATEKGHGDMMKTQPVSPRENILNKSIIPFLIINASIMAGLSIAVFSYYVSSGSVEMARTGVFFVMAFTQLFNVYNMRSLRLSIFKIGFFSNKFINLGIGVSVILLFLVTEVPFLAEIFNFEPLNYQELFVLFVLSSSVLWITELYKWFRNK